MINTKIFKNGLKLVVEEMKGFESVAFNMFVGTGSINETPDIFGISHFIEHMLFKGTKTRNAFEISKTFDMLGANVNAYTNYEETDFYTKSASENLEKCVEIMSDMLFNSIFDKKEIEREKQVVIEEIKMYADDPESKAISLLNKNFYVGTPFERDIAGTVSTVKNLTQNKMFAYKNRYYVPQNITLSFAGNIDFETAQKLVEKYFLPNFKFNGEKVDKIFKKTKAITYSKAYKDNSQSQVLIAFPGLYFDDKNLDLGRIFNVAFGSGMSSILFQSIREKLGLVYSISSSIFTNCAGGDITIELATSTKNVGTALLAVKNEILNILNNGITKEQFENARSNLMSSIRLSFENTSTVSLFNAKKFAKLGKVISKEEYINSVKNARYENLNNYLKNHFQTDNFSVSVVGSNMKIDLKKYFNFNN